MLQRLHLFLFLTVPLLFMAQKPFVGSLEYNVAKVDLISKDTIRGKLFIYALDSLVRFNYLLEDGSKQQSIHLLGKQKFISLIEIDSLFFAIQIKDTSTEKNNFSYRKHRVKQTFCGLKCREAEVIFPNGNALLFYAKSIDASYFVGLNTAPGLPVKGQLPTESGFMAFELTQLDKRTPPIQMFIPEKKYKILSLDDFLKWASEQNTIQDID